MKEKDYKKLANKITTAQKKLEALLEIKDDSSLAHLQLVGSPNLMEQECEICKDYFLEDSMITESSKWMIFFYCSPCYYELKRTKRPWII